MSIPLDFEDILGSALVSSVGRTLSALSCLWLGAATGILGGYSGWALEESLGGGKVEVAPFLAKVAAGCGFGPLVLFGSLCFPLFFPLVFAVFFIFVRGEGGTVGKWAFLAALTGLLALLSLLTWLELSLPGIGLGVVLWLGFAGSLGMLAFVGVAWQRNRLARHLMGVAAENEERRRRLAREFGTATGGREFATGDPIVLPSPKGARPETGLAPPPPAHERLLRRTKRP